MENAIDAQGVKRRAHEPTMLAFGCIHCGKMIFKFSDNLIMRDTVKQDILFECPRCGKTTLLMGDDEMKPGMSVEERLGDIDNLY